MGTGIDWNGNGEYDPIDVGIDIAIEEEENMGLFSSKKKISIGDEEMLKDYLIEAGMSKKEAERYIEEHQDKLARALQDGLLDYLELNLEEDMYL